MDKIKVEVDAIVFGAAEKRKIVACLKYCKHRLVGHGRPIEDVDVKFLDYEIHNLEEAT